MYLHNSHPIELNNPSTTPYPLAGPFMYNNAYHNFPTMSELNTSSNRTDPSPTSEQPLERISSHYSYPHQSFHQTFGNEAMKSNKTSEQMNSNPTTPCDLRIEAGENVTDATDCVQNTQTRLDNNGNNNNNNNSWHKLNPSHPMFPYHASQVDNDTSSSSYNNNNMNKYMNNTSRYYDQYLYNSIFPPYAYGGSFPTAYPTSNMLSSTSPVLPPAPSHPQQYLDEYYRQQISLDSGTANTKQLPLMNRTTLFSSQFNSNPFLNILPPNSHFTQNNNCGITGNGNNSKTPPTLTTPVTPATTTTKEINRTRNHLKRKSMHEDNLNMMLVQNEIYLIGDVIN
ncbi:unnamed protein product [Trichobilharzia szidati]|nr:unnamed protein product [Trichobilharzia szidati]